MTDLPINPILYLMLNLHCLIGGIAAVIARRQGRNLGVWLIIGLIGGTFALIAVLLIKDKKPN
jgi:hypothetical protein